MTIGQSSKTQLGWAKETTYGTFVSCTNPMGAHQSLTPSIRANVQRIRQTGSSRDAAFLLEALQERSVTSDFFVVDGRPLALALEQLSQVATTGEGAPYTHTVDPDAHSDSNSLDSFSMEYVSEDLDTGGKYDGCMVNTLTLSGAGLDTPLQASMDIIAQSVAALQWSERSTVTPHTTEPYKQANCQLQLNDTDFDGAVDNFSFTVANNLQAIPDIAGSTDEIKYCLPGNRDYEVSFTLRPNAKDLYEDLIDCTDQVEVSLKYSRDTNDTIEIVGYGEVLPNEGGLEHPADVGPINLPVTLICQKAKIVVVDSTATFYS